MKRIYMLSNYELFDIAEALNISLDDVMMKDELKQIKRRKSHSVIVNSQRSTDGNGQHWTALIVRGKDKVYFDSFGVVPDTEISAFTGRPLGYSIKQIQDMESEKCGWFCLAFLHYLNHSPKRLFDAYNDFTEMFSGNPKKNDAILLSYFKAIAKGDFKRVPHISELTRK